MDSIITNFLQFQTLLKIYHWQTTSYSRHKASDKLYENLSEKIDKFVETIQGINENRYKVTSSATLKLSNVTDKDATTMLLNFGKWLQKDLHVTDTDLLNIRDEMLAEIDKTLYLFTLN